MKIIRIENCGECPHKVQWVTFGGRITGYSCKELKTGVDLDTLHPDCPLESGECEWTPIKGTWDTRRYKTSCGIYEKLLVDLIDKMPKRTRCPDYQPDKVDGFCIKWACDKRQETYCTIDGYLKEAKDA